MILLNAQEARKIQVPEQVQAEALPDGSLLLAAVEGIFDRQNATHRAAAARIQAALAPLDEG